MEAQKVGIESPVRKLRKETGITQRELAVATGVHQSIVAGLEAGVIAIEEDAEIQGKINELFTKLSEWSGIDKNELLRQQIEYSRAVADGLAEKFADKMKKFVAEKLREGAWEKHFGPQPLTREIVEIIRDCIWDDESPVKILREYAQISQRQLAIAAGVSQTVVARIEAGELSLGNCWSYDSLGLGSGIYAGEKLLRFLVDAIASECEDRELKEQLAGYICSAQENFMEGFAKRAKAKVMETMAKLRKGGKSDKKAATGEVQQN